jgi:hypothetical protein
LLVVDTAVSADADVEVREQRAEEAGLVVGRRRLALLRRGRKAEGQQQDSAETACQQTLAHHV